MPDAKAIAFYLGTVAYDRCAHEVIERIGLAAPCNEIVYGLLEEQVVVRGYNLQLPERPQGQEFGDCFGGRPESRDDVLAIARPVQRLSDKGIPIPVKPRAVEVRTHHGRSADNAIGLMPHTIDEFFNSFAAQVSVLRNLHQQPVNQAGPRWQSDLHRCARPDEDCDVLRLTNPDEGILPSRVIKEPAQSTPVQPGQSHS